MMVLTTKPQLLVLKDSKGLRRDDGGGREGSIRSGSSKSSRSGGNTPNPPWLKLSSTRTPSQTLKPQTLNLRPSTLNPKPEILNPLNPKPFAGEVRQGAQEQNSGSLEPRKHFTRKPLRDLSSSGASSYRCRAYPYIYI